MTVVAIYLVITFGLGGLAMALRLPPLVGFLAAGFVLNALHVAELPQLETMAGLGVTLLLFAIGLKLDVRILLRREVWLTTTAHMVLSVVLGSVALWLAAVACALWVSPYAWVGLSQHTHPHVWVALLLWAGFATWLSRPTTSSAPATSTRGTSTTHPPSTSGCRLATSCCCTATA